MGPGTALLTTLRRSFQFSGRSIRSEFWWSWIILYGVATLILMYRGLPLTGPRTDALLTIALCVLALPMMAVGTRRLADAGVWRWLFVLTIALGTATQLAYMYAMPTATDFAMMTFQAERNDVNLPLSGYELRHVLRALRDDVLPWSSRICAIACLVLALLPTRRAHTLNGPQIPEVTP